MKSVKKILLLTLITLITYQSKAEISTFEKQALIIKMSNEPNVIQLFKNKMTLAMVNGIGVNAQQLPNELAEKISATKIENLHLINYINISFPEYVNLDAIDKGVVIEGILKTPALSAYWDCIASKTTTFALVVCGAGATTSALKIFYACTFSIFVGDVAAVIATGAAVAPEVIAAALPETNLCRFIAIGAASVSVDVVATYVSEIFGCA